MEIVIIEFVGLHPPLERETTTRMQIRFKTRDIEGIGTLISYDNASAPLRIGSRLYVEFDYERIEHFRIVSPDSEEKFFLLSDIGDYAIVGKVVQAWLDNVILVQVHDILFMIEYPEENALEMKIGTMVEFELYSLSLWDTGISFTKRS